MNALLLFCAVIVATSITGAIHPLGIVNAAAASSSSVLRSDNQPSSYRNVDKTVVDNSETLVKRKVKRAKEVMSVEEHQCNTALADEQASSGRKGTALIVFVILFLLAAALATLVILDGLKFNKFFKRVNAA